MKGCLTVPTTRLSKVLNDIQQGKFLGSNSVWREYIGLQEQTAKIFFTYLLNFWHRGKTRRFVDFIPAINTDRFVENLHL